MGFAEKKKEWIKNNPLRKWRVRNSINQVDVAARVNVSYHTVHRWETGAASPSKHLLSILSEIVHFDLKTEWSTWMSARPLIG